MQSKKKKVKSLRTRLKTKAEMSATFRRGSKKAEALEKYLAEKRKLDPAKLREHMTI